jgi:hypothetical protein
MAKPFSRRPLFSNFALKRFSKPSGFGEAVFAFANFGDDAIAIIPEPFGRALFGEAEFGNIEILSGIYQKHYSLTGKYPIRMRMYWPSNPRSILQQANRAKYTASVAAWKALNESERIAWRSRASGKGSRGYDLFRSEYLLTH